MTTRTVTGNIQHLDGSPWANLSIKFELQNGSYVNNVQYPHDCKIVVTDVLGNFTTQLWCNEEGRDESAYVCKLPGDIFTFTVPSGTTPIDIGTLRSLGTAPFPIPIPIRPNKQFLPVISFNQSLFVLSQVSAQPQLSYLFVNGLKTTFGIEYSINTTLLSWLGAYPLDVNDILEIFY